MSFSPKYTLWCWRKYLQEPELRIAARIVKRGSLCLDIGANAGVYSYFLAKRGATVEAFEPIPHLANSLRTRFNGIISVHECVASDSNGRTEIHVPVLKGTPLYGFSSVEKTFESERQLVVEKRTIDSYQFAKVHFLKIDVEGHELAVLKGAERTIIANRPILLIEAEDRHRANAVRSVMSFLEPLGYSGLFWRGRMVPINELLAGGAQVPETTQYVLNFFFVPRGYKFDL